jgi:hypothetical protein
MNTIELVNAAIAGDRDAVMAAFDTTIAQKVSDALELKKVEVASNLLNPQEEVPSDESTEAATEVDGGTNDATETSTESASSTESA